MLITKIFKGLSLKKVVSIICFVVLVIEMIAISPLGEIKAFAAVPADYDNLRIKYSDYMTGGSTYNTSDPDIMVKTAAINQTAQETWDTMDKSVGRTYLWSDYPYNPSDYDSVGKSYVMLKFMILGLKTRGCALYGNATLKADIISGLEFLNANWFNPTKPKVGNWYNYMIGAPTPLCDDTILMYNDLTSTQRTNYMAAVNYFINPTYRDASGANRSWEAQIYMEYGIVTQTDSKIAYARDGLDALLVTATWAQSDGFCWDGSFSGHYVSGPFAYNAGYGLANLTSLLLMPYFLKGSPWEVTNPNVSLPVGWWYSYEPMLFRGSLSPMTQGREMSRQGSEDHAGGHNVISAGLLAIDIGSASDAAYIKTVVKEEILADTYSNYYSDPATSIFLLVKAQAIMNDSYVIRRGDLTLCTQYPLMYKTVQNAPGYSFDISMFGTDAKNYEVFAAPNYENVKGWHQSDGMTYLYTGNDLDQFSDSFWPTVDSYRLPGTTVLQNTTQISTKNGDEWVGGLNDYTGKYGATGMFLNSNDPSSLALGKSWFMFDDEIVCMGAGMQAHTNSATIETIVENRKLNGAGDNAFTVNGTSKSTSLGWSETMTSVNWMNLTGNSTGASIGYYFPTATTVNAKREARSGAWTDISVYNDPTVITRNYLTLWLDHGVDCATSNSYAYVLLPNKTSAQTQAYASAPSVTILKNDAQAQAAWESTLSAFACNFWGGYGNVTVAAKGNPNYLKCDGIASVFTREYVSGGHTYLELAIANPSKQASGIINLEFGFPMAAINYKGPEFTVTQMKPTVKIAVDLSVSAYKGKTMFLKARVN